MDRSSGARRAEGVISLQQQPRARKRTRRLRAGLGKSSLLIIPALAVVVGLLLVPIAGVLVRSFEAGLSDYVWAVAHEQNRRVFATTLQTAWAVTELSVSVAYPYAYVLSIAGPVPRTV